MRHGVIGVKRPTKPSPSLRRPFNYDSFSPVVSNLSLATELGRRTRTIVHSTPPTILVVPVVIFYPSRFLLVKRSKLLRQRDMIKRSIDLIRSGCASRDVLRGRATSDRGGRRGLAPRALAACTRRVEWGGHVRQAPPAVGFGAAPHSNILDPN